MRGHSDLNRGPLDLQSNALPLSYTPNSIAHLPPEVTTNQRVCVYNVCVCVCVCVRACVCVCVYTRGNTSLSLSLPFGSMVFVCL